MNLIYIFSLIIIGVYGTPTPIACTMNIVIVSGGTAGSATGPDCLCNGASMSVASSNVCKEVGGVQTKVDVPGNACVAGSRAQTDGCYVSANTAGSTVCWNNQWLKTATCTNLVLCTYNKILTTAETSANADTANGGIGCLCGTTLINDATAKWCKSNTASTSEQTTVPGSAKTCSNAATELTATCKYGTPEINICDIGQFYYSNDCHDAAQGSSAATIGLQTIAIATMINLL